MQVILLEDVPSLGGIGDQVKVSEGYGRNYLIPQKKAILATEKNMKVLAHQKRQVQHHIGRLKKDAESLAETERAEDDLVELPIERLALEVLHRRRERHRQSIPGLRREFPGRGPHVVFAGAQF